jgi:hypothetical protein
MASFSEVEDASDTETGQTMATSGAPARETEREELLARLTPTEREVVLAELKGRSATEQEDVLRHVHEMLLAGEADEDGAPAGSERLPTEEELDELWTQVFEVVTDEDRSTIEKALDGRSLAERYDIFCEVEQQLASDEDGGETPTGKQRTERRGSGLSIARRDEDNAAAAAREGDDDDDGVEDGTSALEFDELRERWALAFEQLCDADKKVLLGSMDEQDALGQTRLLLAVEEQIRSPQFEKGKTILGDGEDDEEEEGAEDSPEDSELRMAEVLATIQTMEEGELQSEFDACFELLLERTEPSAEADADAQRLQAEWEDSPIEHRRELLYQLVFCLNNPPPPFDGEAEEADDDDVSDALPHAQQQQQPFRPQKLGDSVGFRRRGGAERGAGGGGYADAEGAKDKRKRPSLAAAKRSGWQRLLPLVLVPAVMFVLGWLSYWLMFSQHREADSELSTQPVATWREEGVEA